MIGERGNFRVRVEGHEATAELVAVADVDQVSVVFCFGDAEFEQLLEHDGYLDPVGRCHGVELQGVFADGKRLVVGGAGDRAVGAAD